MSLPLPPPSNLIPDQPGCYLFSDREGRIIYIGKANHLRRRVKSYFQRKTDDPKTRAMLEKASGIEFILTGNEVEALILENTLIKKYQPHYNIDLKDAKQHAYIMATDDAFPALKIARRREEAGRYFGPFVSAQQRDDVLSSLVRIFRLRTCKRFPKKPCLRFHLHLCQGPCTGEIHEAEYRTSLERAVDILKGKTQELLERLREEMKKNASDRIYERALELRNQIHSIERLEEKQHVLRQKKYDEHVLNFQIKDGTFYLMIFGAKRGVLSEKQEFIFTGHDEEALEEFLIRFYSENDPPRELILPRPVSPALKEYLKTERHLSVVWPSRGEKKELLKLVAKNLENAFFLEDLRLAALQNRLNLPQPPRIIECLDISHLSGTSMVGSLVRFTGGKPDKRHYRRFRIRSVAGVDDFSAVAEVVRRRYGRLLREESEMPHLLVIDGGAGQLSAALRELKSLNVQIPALALAKRLEEIYLPGEESPLKLPLKDEALLLLRAVRDEAHRFAVSYHHLLRRRPLKAPSNKHRLEPKK